jgi:hypothetical protein
MVRPLFGMIYHTLFGVDCQDLMNVTQKGLTPKGIVTKAEYLAS